MVIVSSWSDIFVHLRIKLIGNFSGVEEKALSGMVVMNMSYLPGTASLVEEIDSKKFSSIITML